VASGMGKALDVEPMDSLVAALMFALLVPWFVVAVDDPALEMGSKVGSKAVHWRIESFADNPAHRR